MYACPRCSHHVQDFELKCPRCDVELKTMALLHELPDVQFNQALQAAKICDWGTASQLLGAVLAVRVKDIEAWLLLGLVYARRGTFDLARDCWRLVLAFQPGEARASNALNSLNQVVPAPQPEKGA